MPRLLERVIQRRRSEGAEPDGSEATAARQTEREQIEALARRVDHLESLLEGLQDSVHREAVRRGQEIEELQEKTEAEAIARSLSQREHERRL